MVLILAVILSLGIPVVSYIVINLFVPDTKPIGGVYASPGGRWYTAKWLLMYFVLTLRHWRHVRQKDNNKHTLDPDKNLGYGVRSHRTGEEMESFHDLGEHPDGNNSVYMYGINPVDGTLIDVRIAKRQNNMREVWFFLKMPGLEDFIMFPRHPCTMVHDVSSNGFDAAGLTVKMDEPMKTWDILYEGDCRLGVRENLDGEDRRKTVHVSCCLRWTAFTPYVNFDTDINPRLMAENIAKEKWSGELFDNIKRLHQTHYEQFGEITGHVTIDRQSKISVSAKGIRDRSFGPRRWDDFLSYCILFAVFEDGTSLHAGAFCMPKTFSHLKSGFLIDKNKTKIGMVSSTLSLHDLLSEGTLAEKFSFTIKMANGIKYTVSIHVEPNSTVSLFPDDKQEIKIFERKSKFDLDGIKGNGICEILTR